MKAIIAVAAALWMAVPVFSQADTSRSPGINLEQVEYPFAVNYIDLTIQNERLRMAYMDVMPQRPNGKVVVLLHGKNFNGAYWEQTARDLSAAGYRVIVPDQVGFGKSTKPERIQYSFQLLATNTNTLLEQLNIRKIALLGHSMGGMLATRFALMFPEKVEKLILENPIGLEDWKTLVPYRTVEDWYRSELDQNYARIKAYQTASYYGGNWKPEYEKWARMLAGWTKDEQYPRIAWNSALLYDMIFTQPVYYEFGNLQMPVLLIIGQRDRTAIGKDKAPESLKQQLGNYPELGRRAAAKIPRATLEEIPDTGHLPHIESYELFIRPLKEFLAR
jgi:pimeloyl-ACP methyl ester carboxylesterase